MSYCRFSSDDFQCDVYAYQSEHGYELHVASNRYIIDRSKLPPRVGIGTVQAEVWLARYAEVCKVLHEAMVNNQLVTLTLPHAGESFTFDTPGELAAFLRKLKALGYNVPADAIEALDEEAKATNEEPA